MTIQPRILFLAPLHPPVHGASMMSQYLKESKRINETFRCDFINSSTSRKIDEIGRRPFVKALRFALIYIKVLAKLLSHRYDVAYIANTCYGVGFLKDMPFILLCKLFAKNVVLHQHNQGARMYVHRRIYKWLMPLAYKNTKVILLSWELYDDMKEVISKSQVMICPNGTPPVNECVGMKIEKNRTIPRLLYLSNLLKEKGILVLLDALKILKDEGLVFVCDIVGGETADFDKNGFVKEIKNRGLEEVAFYYGPKYGTDKIPFWNNADIFVLPTLRECFPLVLCEAMQNKLACIASKEGAIPSILEDGVSGLLFEKGNHWALANCLKFLIENKTERQDIADAGYRKYQRDLTIESFEKSMMNCLKKVMNE